MVTLGFLGIAAALISVAVLLFLMDAPQYLVRSFAIAASTVAIITVLAQSIWLIVEGVM